MEYDRGAEEERVLDGGIAPSVCAKLCKKTHKLLNILITEQQHSHF